MSLPTRLVSVIAVVMLASFAWAETVGTNLVANSGFEAGNGKLDVWTWGSADDTKTAMVLDDAVAHSGKYSVRIHSELPGAPHVYCGLVQTVRGLAPETDYVLRLWAKGKGVGTCWFGGGPGWFSRGQFPTGDFDWTMLELRWRSPDVATDYELRLNVDSETEALWIDDVSFQEANPQGLDPRVTVLAPEAAVRAGYLPMAPVERGPKIDGDLSDWPADARAVRMPQDAGVVALPDRKGDDDLSATVRTMADGKALYLGITVRDDIHSAAPGAMAWTNDSIQLGIDPRHERTEARYGPHDSEYSLMMDSEGKPQVQCWVAPAGLGDQSRAFTLAVKRTGLDTVYEVEIPWTAIGVMVGAGGPVLGLDVLVNDNDGTGRRGYIEMTPGIGKSKDPSQYVTATGSDRYNVAVVPAKPVAYTGEPVDVKAVVVLGQPLAADATVELAAVDGKGKVTVLTTATLAMGMDAIVQIASRLPAEKLPATMTQLRARVVAAVGRR